jgi:segregation and condensation protein A
MGGSMTDDLERELLALEAEGAEGAPEPPDPESAGALARRVGVRRATPAEAAEGAPPGARGSVTVKLERFEGPLDLLLHLIKRDEIDIYDIPIAHITSQYLAYLELMRSLDLEIAGEFLVMAATLMRIKAKMLLPLPAAGEEEDEGDPREELVQRLIEYRQFKEAANTLKLREEERRQLFERGMVPSEDEAGPRPLAPATLYDLLDALNRVLARVPHEVPTYAVEGEQYDLEEKIAQLGRVLAERRQVSFIDLLASCRARAEMIVTFIALLEMIKLGDARVVQAEPFGDITILARRDGADGEEESVAHAPDESRRGD